MLGAARGYGFSYFGNRYLDHARRDLRAMAEAGASFVVHVMTEDDLRWNPRSVGDLIAATLDEGLQPWLDPWGVAGVFGGEAASYAVMEHPDACQVDSLGRHRPALCPGHPRFRGLMECWLDTAASTGVPVVMIDEPHLFVLRHQRTLTKWCCRCAGCQAAFADRFAREMPSTWDGDVHAFAEQLIADVTAWLVVAAAKRRLGSAVVLLPDDGYDAALWRRIATLPGVVAFGTDPYHFGHPNDPAANRSFVRLWSERTVAATIGTSARPMGWVQAFRVPAGRESELTWVVDEIEAAGVETIGAWAYRGCAGMSSLASDNPEEVWATLGRRFNQVRVLPASVAVAIEHAAQVLREHAGAADRHKPPA